MSDLLTIAEVAALVRLHRTTVKAAIDRGELEASCLCGRWRVRPDAVEAWLAATIPAPVSRRPHLTAVPHFAPPHSEEADSFPLVRRKVG